jgi:hypothetical protein
MTPEPGPAENLHAVAVTNCSAPLTREMLAERGFLGFVPFADLPRSTVPAGEGIYVVLRSVASLPVLLTRNPAGHRKVGLRDRYVLTDHGL